MKIVGRLALVFALALSSVACKTIDERYYYRQGITAFEKHIPPSNKTCWLTPDFSGGSSGNDAIAEEEFTKYLLEKNLCRVVEKHPDDVAGYTWPKDEVCPCGANVTNCSAACAGTNAGGAAGAAGGLFSGGLSLGGGAGHDNNRSNDKLLERYKKAQLADKVLVYRIDKMDDKKAVIHFRLSDAKANNGTIEQSQYYVIPAKVEVTAESSQ